MPDNQRWNYNLQEFKNVVRHLKNGGHLSGLPPRAFHPENIASYPLPSQIPPNGPGDSVDVARAEELLNRMEYLLSLYKNGSLTEAKFQEEYLKLKSEIGLT